MPFNAAASELAASIERTLIDGALLMQDEDGLFMHWHPKRRPTLYGAVQLLLADMDYLDRCPPERALAVVRWMDEQHLKARRLILGPSDRWYAGVCGAPLSEVLVGLDESADGVLRVAAERLPAGTCPARLFTSTCAEKVTCKACNTVYNVAERRARLVAEAEDELRPIDEIVDALPWLVGFAVNKSTARNWRRDRRYMKARPATADRPAQPARPWRSRVLFAQGLDIDGRELFRVGDVIELAKAAKARSEARNGTVDLP